MEKTRNSNGEKLSGDHRAKINLFVILSLCIFLIIPMVSALEIDNRKDVKQSFGYSEIYKDIVIENVFGLGKTLWSGSLKQNTDKCGTDCSARTDITLHEEGSLVDNIIFKTLQEDGKWIEQDIRSYKFLLETSVTQIEVPEYETVCEEVYFEINQTYGEVCEEVFDGYTLEDTPQWREYSLGEVLPIGDYTLKLMGEKKPSRTVDWIIQSQGEWLDEWATWGGGFNQEGYYQVIYATSIQEDAFNSGNVSITEHSTGIWVINSTNSVTAPDIARGEIMEILYKPVTIASITTSKIENNITSTTAIYTSDLRDDNKKAIYFYWSGGTSGGSGCATCAISQNYTLSPLTNNEDMSFWGYVQAGGVNGHSSNFQIPSGITQLTIGDGTLSTYGTNTTNNDTDNSNSFYSYAYGLGQNWAYSGGSGNVVLLSSANITTRDYTVSSCDVATKYDYDYEINVSIPRMTYLEGTITLNSPADAYISPSNTVTFNATATVTGGATLTNMSLWHNGTGTWARNQTEVYSGGNDAHGVALTLDGSFTARIGIRFVPVQNSRLGEVYPKAGYTGTIAYLYEGTGTTQLANASITGGVATFDYNLQKGVGYIIAGDKGGATYARAINAPYSSFPIVGTYFNITESWTIGTGSAGAELEFLQNMTLYTPTSSIQTFNTTINSPTLWGIEACDSDGDCGFSTENRTVSVDTIAPTITINAPTSTLNFGSSTTNETLNWTVVDSSLSSVWWDYNGTNTTLVGASNQTTFTLESGDYNGTLWANDSVGNINSSTINWIYKIFQNSETYNTTTYETASETYSINVTANSSLTAASLVWNGTSYAGTKSGTVWSKTIDVPTGVTNKSFYWNFTYAGSGIASTAHNVSVQDTNFSICGGVGGSVPYLNFTFKDESDSTPIANGTIPSSTFVYYLGDGTTNKTLSYINNTGNPEYAFCATPPDRSLTIDGLIQYEDAEGTYIQRVINPASASFSNATTNTTLYLLKSTDGIYVTFQVINVAEQAVPSVTVTGTRVIDTVTTTVASGTTDASGSVTFFLDSDFQHTFLFESTAYDDYTTVIFPTQSAYTITLGSGTDTPADDYNQDITIAVNPANVSLVNDTTYNFQMVLDTSFWEVSEFGFVLTNSSGSVVGSASTSASGGTASVNYNVGNTTSYILMNHYYVIAGNYTNSTRQWYVFSSAGTEYSILHFFTDFSNYSTDGELFGMGAFAKGILVFLIIFLFVGIMSYKFGLISPAGISILAFGLTLFFDYLGFIPRYGSAVVGFPTIMMGIILLAVMLKEVFR